MKFFCASIALVLSVNANAEYQAVEEGLTTEKTLPAEDLSQLPTDTIKYAWRFEDFATWAGHEKKMLNLFDGFQQKSDNPLEVMIAKDTAILNKPATAIDLRPFVTPKVIRTVDMKITAIGANDVVTYQNANSSYRNPPAPAHWCDGSSTNSSCIQTLFVLPGSEASALHDQWQKDHYKELIGQSEFRILSGNEIQNASDWQKLTKIDATKPTGVVIQNGFWFSHILGFAKAIVVLQPLPTDPQNKTLVTAFFVFGVEQKYWKAKYGESLGKPQTGAMYMQGKSMANGTYGLGKGVPKYTAELFGNALKVLSR